MALKDIIGKVAPTIASAIGGPVGNLALTIAKEALGLHKDAPESAVLEKVKDVPPEVAQQLMQADQAFRIRCRELDIDETKLAIDAEKLDVDDRANARAREVSLHDWVTKVLAIGTFGLFAATTIAVMFVSIPKDNAETVKAMIEVEKLLTMTVLAYYFGSSAGSRFKDWVDSRRRAG